ncbi:MAG: methyltransferase [candidate division WOR-3 bacterium]
MRFRAIRWKRLVWTLLVTFYFINFFRNLFRDALPGLSWLPLLFFIPFTLWMAVEYYFGSPFFQSGLVEPSQLWKGLFALFYYPFLAFSVADFIWLHWGQITRVVPYLNILGVLIFLLGSYLRLATLRTLMRAVPGRLVHHGLFRIVRHPRYLGTLVQLLAVPVTFSSWLGLVICLAIGLPLVLKQIAVEETRLTENLGDELAAYRNLPALIPFRIRRSSGS